MQERIVITGMGTVNPLGLNVSESWRNVTNGVSGVGPITLFDIDGLQVHIACEVKNFEPEHFMEAREARRRDRFEQLSTAAIQEALTSFGVRDQRDRTRTGLERSSHLRSVDSNLCRKRLLQTTLKGPGG